MLAAYIPFFSNTDEDPVEEDIAEITIGVVFAFSIVFIFLNYKIVQYLDDYRWIKRERSLLDALTKDFQTANKSVEEIKLRANQAWESELNMRGMTQTLSEIEKKWLMKEAKVISDVQRYVDDYEKLIPTNEASTNLFKWYAVVLLALKNPIAIVELALGIHRITKEIKSQLQQKKEYTNSIVKELEESRMKVRSLQDRPIQEAEQSSVLRPKPLFRSAVALVLERLVTVEPGMGRGLTHKVSSFVIQLRLLRAFIKDLQKLRFDSELEKAWAEEAQEISARSLNDVNTILKDAADHRRWFSKLSIVPNYFLLRPKLETIITNVRREMSHLLETKQRYGFSFIKRERDSFRDVVITPTVIPDQLNDEEQLDDEAVNNLRVELQNTRRHLNEEEATNVAIHTRKACLEFLTETFHEVKPIMKIKRIRQIEETLEHLKLCKEVYKIKVMEDSCFTVGLEVDILKLLKMISDTNKFGSVISVVGMKGVGKTTIVKELFNHDSIIDKFHTRRHFVSVPEEMSNVSLLRNVGNQILRPQDEKSDQEDWIKELQGFLKRDAKPHLIVLDNLLSKKAWDILKPAVVSDGTTRPIILITTRDKAVASHANLNPLSTHSLRLRTTEESWEFFTQIVSCPSNEEDIELAKKVVLKTGGLPLAILRIGYLLSGKEVTKEELSVVLQRVTQGQNQTPWVAVRDIIKEDLPFRPDLEHCLSDFELFPRDFEISARRLVALWVARGLTQRSDGMNAKTQEAIAHEYLMELIGRNIIQIVKKKLNGKVLTCRFPGILRELWLADRANNTAARSWSLCGTTEQKLAYRFDDEDTGFSRRIHRLDHSNLLPEESCPLSITFFDTREGDQPGLDIQNFLCKAIKTGRLLDLVVLDLEHVYKPQLPDVIANLTKLTYLGLRWTKIEKLPKTIGKLLDLQTLDLKHTQVRKLPSSIWKLKKLRNLHLNGSCRMKCMTLPNNLHKLSGALVDEEGAALVKALPKLHKLQKLRLTIHLDPRLREDLARNIQELTKLRSLSLKSINESGNLQELYVPDLNKFTQLSSLTLSGKITRSSIIFDLPGSLTELTLSSSELLRGSLIMPMLGNYLPELKFLYFLADSYSGKEIVCSVGFPKLLVLKLWNLPNLEKLEVKEGVMSSLRTFEIRCCLQLTATNTELPKLATLTELKLSNMPDEYTAELKRKLTKLNRNLPIKTFTFDPDE
ncbi:hypothetical protein F8388_021536 [Cannabis sativa]|nr:hypothetical protein F8388_021536 [Cannabis sativa]